MKINQLLALSLLWGRYIVLTINNLFCCSLKQYIRQYG